MASSMSRGRRSDAARTFYRYCQSDTSGSVSRGLLQTLTFVEELTQHNEQLERRLDAVTVGEGEYLVVLKALRQNIVLVKKLYAHIGASVDLDLHL